MVKEVFKVKEKEAALYKAETENAPAVHAYRAVGFEDVPYLELWKK